MAAKSEESKLPGNELRVCEPSDQNAASSDTNPGQQLLSYAKGADWPEVIPAVWDLFIASATKHSDALAIASIQQKGEHYGLSNLPLDHKDYIAQPYLRWTYGEFINGITRLVGALLQVGAKPSLPVFTFVNNCAEHPLIFWAAATLGCTIVPIHPRNLLNREEIVHILTTAISTTREQKAIIFVQNDDLAEQVLNLGILYETCVVTIDASNKDRRHDSFSNFINSAEPTNAAGLGRHQDSAKRWTMIVFTSGTTAFPKGVVFGASDWDRWMLRRRTAVPLVPGDSILSTLPNNHAFYYLNLLTFLGVGGAMVLPGTAFSPQAVPEVMEMEQCSHLPMPPTMIHAVCQVASDRGIKFRTLKNVTIGGSKLSVEHARGCFEILGSRGVEVIYGTTECGVFVTTGIVTTIDDVLRNGDIAVGKVDIGAEVKICAPSTTTPLPRHTEGEVHYGSLLRSDGYAGKDMSDAFYTDEAGQKWFVTGDAGTMNEEGLIFIVGRIKDMIVRGARNISPAAIEFILSQDDRTRNFNVQVVGKLDPVAGEVPVAISQKSVAEQEIVEIQDTILKHMGPAFLPEKILSIGQLGLEDFPRTLLGKVQKHKLSQVVRDYFVRNDVPQQSDAVEVDELTEKIQKVWKRTIGHTVSMDASISDFADSITIMRVRDRYAKDLGIDISLEEILTMQTIRDQVTLLKQTPERSRIRKPIKERPGVLTEKDLIHLSGRPEWFPSTKAYITDQISSAGFTWEDIQTVTPASDFTHVLTQADILNTSWSWKFALVAKSGVNKPQIRTAIEAVLANNPLLSSYLFADRAAFGSDISLHVIPRTNEKLFEAVFKDYGSVSTKEEFGRLVFKPYEYEMTTLPGILIQWLLFDIQETGQSGTIMVAHHATTDASYMQLVFEDLDKALGGSIVLDDHVKYETWADSYYSLRTSHAAQVAVSWHTNRLRDLSSHKDSVFPPLPRPHHFSSSTQHIQSIDDNGYHTDFQATGITNLRRKHPLLSAPTIIKAAWSLLNMYHNGTDTAVFSNLQADRRRFPFVPTALEALSPSHSFEASNVAGQTLQDVVNIIPLHPEETIIDFLHRIAADQEELNMFAAAPLQTILQDIGPVNSEIMLDVLRSQIFNWTPGLGAMQTHNPYETYEPVSSFIRPSLRLVINVDVGGQNDETVFAQIKSPLYDKDGLHGLAHDFECFVLWICDETSWGTRSGDFKVAVKQRSMKSEQVHGGVKKEHIL